MGIQIARPSQVSKSTANIFSAHSYGVGAEVSLCQADFYQVLEEVLEFNCTQPTYFLGMGRQVWSRGKAGCGRDMN